MSHKKGPKEGPDRRLDLSVCIPRSRKPIAQAHPEAKIEELALTQDISRMSSDRR